MCFSSSLVWDFVKNITRKLANKISYKIEMFRRGVQICEGGSISASGFGPWVKGGGGGGGVQIRGGFKSAVTYRRLYI